MAGTGKIKDITSLCIFLMIVEKGITEGSIPILDNGPHRETVWVHLEPQLSVTKPFSSFDSLSLGWLRFP